MGRRRRRRRTRQLVGTGPAHFPTWLPPDGKEIVYRWRRANPGIYAIAADGTGERRALSTTPANNEFDYQAIAVSPDGSHITFTRWSDDGSPAGVRPGRRDRRGDRVPDAARDRSTRGATFSPDGALVAYARIFADGGFQLVVANADGSGNERTIGPRKPAPPGGSDVPASWAFTPDGTALMVRFGDDAEADDPSPAARWIAGDRPRFRRVRVRRHPAPGTLTPLRSRTPAGRPPGGRPCHARRGYNRAMAHRVTLIPGDGIGPELAEATRRVLDATGIALRMGGPSTPARP